MKRASEMFFRNQLRWIIYVHVSKRIYRPTEPYRLACDWHICHLLCQISMQTLPVYLIIGMVQGLPPTSFHFLQIELHFLQILWAYSRLQI